MGEMPGTKREMQESQRQKYGNTYPLLTFVLQLENNLIALKKNKTHAYCPSLESLRSFLYFSKVRKMILRCNEC